MTSPSPFRGRFPLMGSGNQLPKDVVAITYGSMQRLLEPGRPFNIVRTLLHAGLRALRVAPVMGGYATSLSRRWLVEKGLRLAQADRADAAGEAPRTTQGGLAVRLQLRRPQLMQTPQADGPECGVRPPGRAVPPRSPEPPRRLKRSMHTGQNPLANRIHQNSSPKRQ